MGFYGTEKFIPMVTILILGFLFGAILQYARLNRFNVIMGLSVREDFTVPKAIAFAVGIGAILLNIEIALGFASYHVKPLILGGIILGGVSFNRFKPFGEVKYQMMKDFDAQTVFSFGMLLSIL